MTRLARYALVLCLLAVAAAVVSFVNGNWLGIVWVLLAGLTSNMWWYFRRKGQVEARAAAEAGSGAGAGAEAAGTAR